MNVGTERSRIEESHSTHFSQNYRNFEEKLYIFKKKSEEPATLLII